MICLMETVLLRILNMFQLRNKMLIFENALLNEGLDYYEGDQKVSEKVLLNQITFIDCNENSQIRTFILD